MADNRKLAAILAVDVAGYSTISPPTSDVLIQEAHKLIEDEANTQH